jgi:hypothetical protein
MRYQLHSHNSQPVHHSNAFSLAAVTMFLISSVSAFAHQGSFATNPQAQIHNQTVGQSAEQNTPSQMTPPNSAVSGATALGGLMQNVATNGSQQRQVTNLNSNCGHVIELLLANKLRQNTFQNGLELAPGLVLGSPWQQRLGDLELLSVYGDGTIDPRNGPVFEVALRNNSQAVLENVTISAVAVLGQIHEQSPTSVLSIGRIEATETISIRIRLPASSMVMGPVGTPVIPFETLVVTIDSFDELVESNELNNISVLRRSEIPMIPIAVVAPASLVMNQQSPLLTQPPAGPSIAVPEETTPVSPLDAIDPDKLGEEMPTTN